MIDISIVLVTVDTTVRVSLFTTVDLFASSFLDLKVTLCILQSGQERLR